MGIIHILKYWFKVQLAIVFCLVLVSHAFAADGLVAKIQATYESLQSFDTNFSQVLRNTASGEEQHRDGMFFFKKPNLVRWETTSPEEELLIVGENVVWDYFSDEQVAYKYETDAVLDSKTMIRFISGQARLDEDFWITEEPDEQGMAKLNLAPKEPEPQLVQAYIWVERETALVKRILLQDFYGNENELIFEDIKINPDLPTTLFNFSPPADVEIFDNTVQFGVQEKDITQ